MSDADERTATVERWRAIHREAGDDDLDAVCHHHAPRWFNAHSERQQKRAFAHALTHVGDLEGLAVFELGCGRGRWTRLLRDRGARVHAVDVSEEAIARNARELPDVAFEAGDFLELDVPSNAYDIAISITVVQHVPHPQQDEAVARLARLLRPRGHAVLLESLRVGPLTYGRPLAEWIELFGRHGLRPVDVHGYAFDIPLRALQSLVARGRGGVGRTAEAPPPTERSTARALYWSCGVRPAVALSAATESLARKALPAAAASHAAFVFRKDD